MQVFICSQCGGRMMPAPPKELTRTHQLDRLLDAACDYLKRCAGKDSGDPPTPDELLACAAKIQDELEGGDS